MSIGQSSPRPKKNAGPDPGMLGGNWLGDRLLIALHTERGSDYLSKLERGWAEETVKWTDRDPFSEH